MADSSNTLEEYDETYARKGRKLDDLTSKYEEAKLVLKSLYAARERLIEFQPSQIKKRQGFEEFIIEDMEYCANLMYEKLSSMIL